MANTNSVAGVTQSGTLRNQFPTQTVAATTETALLLNTDSGTATCFIIAPSGGEIYGARAPRDVNANPAITARSGREYGVPSGEANDLFSSSSWDGRPFKVRICGIGNAGANAAQTLLVNLYQGTSATLGSDVKIASTGAALATVAGGAFQFYIEARLLWDSGTGLLTGSFDADIAFGSSQQYTVTKAILAVPTAVTTAGLSFLASLTLGNAASSTITVREFIIDKV